MITELQFRIAEKQAESAEKQAGGFGTLEWAGEITGEERLVRED
jgi:hypothetical protein